MTNSIRAFVVLLAATLLTTTFAAAQPIDIGSRLELMIDDYLIESQEGVELRLHPPTPREVAITFDAPWEGSACGYYTVFQDGPLYRMYYRGLHYIVEVDKFEMTHRQVVCYAESRDGVHWTKPDLGIIDFEGTTSNNIIWDGDGKHNFSPFIDTNPACPPEEKYKALGGDQKGLHTFKSADGIHWTQKSDKPVITRGAFDSQNIGFWDETRGRYVAYFRTFTKIDGKSYRSIAMTASQDFAAWSLPTALTYPGAQNEQLYTNGILPYYRAPHILLGFPTRYVARPVTEHVKTVHPLKLRSVALKAHQRVGTDLTDGLFMTSRDGLAFKRWDEVYARPGLQQKGNWMYGNMYQNWGLIETPWDATGVGPISLEGVRVPRELSIYQSEGGWLESENRLRRYTTRIDGFVSMHAPLKGGEFATKPLLFTGKELVINYSSSAAGSVRVEIQNPDGSPVAGYALADCPEIYGDTIDQVVSWKVGPDVSALAGKPVRLRFVLKDADLYSLRFR